MNTAYNTTSTTTVQESRNRYNKLLAQALKRINDRKSNKTAQEPEETTATPEEVTTTATEVTTTPTQQPEEVTTEEDATPAPATDDATLLRNLIDQYGNVGADYLDTLDYSKATKQEPRTVTSGRAKVTEKRYTIGTPDEFGYLQTYGLSRSYNRNGKRNMFFVPKGWEIIEMRWYGKNNNTYKASVKIEAGTLRYQIEDGIVTRAELTKKDGNKMKATFDDTNRPATPRDLPAPAPSKTTIKEETTKEETATPVQEQPTSKTATPETTTATEVTTTSTDQPEDEPTPYWLLLDNELRAQQEEQEQEQALATPEKSEEEPEEEPAPDNEETDDPEEVGFLKGAELEKAIDEYIEKTVSERLDLKFYKSHYYYYITTDGYIVKLDKSKPKKDLYIPDEGPFYESYAKGEITDRDIFFAKNMKTLDKYMRERLETPVLCSVRRTMMGDLSIDPFGRTEYSYDPSTGKSEELPTKRPTPRELAIYVAAWDAYEADQRARLERYWKRYAHKVCVNTYWANR